MHLEIWKIWEIYLQDIQLKIKFKETEQYKSKVQSGDCGGEMDQCGPNHLDIWKYLRNTICKIWEIQLKETEQYESKVQWGLWWGDGSVWTKPSWHMKISEKYNLQNLRNTVEKNRAIWKQSTVGTVGGRWISLDWTILRYENIWEIQFAKSEKYN